MIWITFRFRQLGRTGEGATRLCRVVCSLNREKVLIRTFEILPSLPLTLPAVIFFFSFSIIEANKRDTSHVARVKDKNNTRITRKFLSDNCILYSDRLVMVNLHDALDLLMVLFTLPWCSTKGARSLGFEPSTSSSWGKRLGTRVAPPMPK